MPNEKRTTRERGLFKRGRIWWVCYKDYQGNYRRESTGHTSKKRAMECLAARRVERSDYKFHGRKPPCDLTFRQLCDRFLKWSKSEKTAASYERDLSLTANLCKVFGKRPAISITREDLDRYRMARKQEVSGASVNREMSCCRRVFNLAIAWELLEHNPASHIGMFTETRRMKFLRIKEQRQLLVACRESRQPLLYPIVVLALTTGCRRGELMALRWRHLDLASKTLTVETSKNHLPRTVPLCPQAVHILQGLPRGAENDKLFPVGDIKKSYAGALRRAGLVGFTFHDLRHTAASTLVNQGVDLLTVQRLLGHESLAMTLRYSHLTDRKLRDAANQMPDIVSQDGMSASETSVGRVNEKTH
ncbi:MAG TPA: tyrosine-type recombinase/integrase [bacterium]|nr:tyrosine-type recombinase/integrase [bacterium]